MIKSKKWRKTFENTNNNTFHNGGGWTDRTIGWIFREARLADRGKKSLWKQSEWNCRPGYLAYMEKNRDERQIALRLSTIPRPRNYEDYYDESGVNIAEYSDYMHYIANYS